MSQLGCNKKDTINYKALGPSATDTVFNCGSEVENCKS